MTESRRQKHSTTSTSRRDAMSRLGRLADASLDDLTRELQTRVALGNLDTPAMLVDLDGTVLDTNDEVGSFGFRRNDLRGRPLWAGDSWTETDAAATVSPLIERAANGELASRTIEAGRDQPRPLRLDITPLRGVDGDVALLLAELHRLSDRVETAALMAETNERLAAAEDIFRAVAEYTSDLVCLHTADGTYTYVSPSVRRLLDRDPKALIGTHPVDLAHAKTREALVAGLRDASRRGAAPITFRHRLEHRNGSYRWFETAVTPIRDATGRVRQLQSSSRDITRQQEKEQSLIKQAFHDELTGLANKALLLDRMIQSFAISQRTTEASAVLFIDLDGFKTINDTLGHHVGDVALAHVAERLKAIVRPGDTLARLGGDEFVILCAGTDGARGASIVARRLLDAFLEPFVLEGHEVRLGASIGIATSNGDDDPESVIERADTAMYEAKHRGKGQYAIHDEVDQRIEVYRSDTAAALERAITEGELRLHYQPELDLDTGEIVGFEALVRWQAPDGSLISPGEFIPLAEETGLIVELGRWVIAEACRQAALWRVHRSPDQEPIRIWVNLSAHQLSDPDLVAFVERSVADAGITTDEICMEITESALIDHADSATQQLDQLRRLGISLGIDDFGTGYSQFAYLNRLPLDVLKIDRSFVDDLGKDENAAVIVSALIELAHALGMIVIAEGVETKEQLNVLEQLDCDQALGFYFSEPREAMAFEHTLSRAEAVDV